MIDNGAALILLQEVNRVWSDFISSHLRHGWGFWRPESTKTVTLWDPLFATDRSRVVLPVWPEKKERANAYRFWRKFGVVRRGGPHPFLGLAQPGPGPPAEPGARARASVIGRGPGPGPGAGGPRQHTLGRWS